MPFYFKQRVISILISSQYNPSPLREGWDEEDLIKKLIGILILSSYP